MLLMMEQLINYVDECDPSAWAMDRDSDSKNPKNDPSVHVVPREKPANRQIRKYRIAVDW